MVSAVSRTIQPAARAARRGINAPGRSARLPQRGKYGCRIPRLECEVNRAGVLIMEQHFLPVSASIFRTKDAALLVRSISVTQCGHEDAVCVMRIHQDPSDLARIAQSNLLPGFSRLRGLVHPISNGNGRTHVRFPGTYINDVGVRWRRSNRSNRGNRLRVKNRLPCAACVVRFPNAAAHTSKIVGVRLPSHASDRQHASATKRSNRAPTQLLEKLRIDLLWRIRAGI